MLSDMGKSIYLSWFSELQCSLCKFKAAARNLYFLILAAPVDKSGSLSKDLDLASMCTRFLKRVFF